VPHAMGLRPPVWRNVPYNARTARETPNPLVVGQPDNPVLSRKIPFLEMTFKSTSRSMAFVTFSSKSLFASNRVPWRAQGSAPGPRAADSEAGIRGHHSASATPASQVCWQRHGSGGYPWAPHQKFQSTAKSRLDTAAAPCVAAVGCAAG